MATALEQVSALWAWLLKRWLYVLAVCVAIFLLVGGLGVWKSEETKQVAVEQIVYTRKQVRQKDREIAARNDSIKIITVYVDRWHRSADSSATVARRADARADSLLRATPPAPNETPTTEYLTAQLEAYKPKAYRLPEGDSIR